MKKEIKKLVDKMDAEIMDWVYEVVKINFDVVLVQDSTDLRDILERNITEMLAHNELKKGDA